MNDQRSERSPGGFPRCGGFVALLLAGGLWSVWPVAAAEPETPSPEDQASEPAEGSEEHQVQWLTSLDEARARARIRRSPILTLAGADWCGPCRMLDAEIRLPVVQSELERWLPVHVDVDAHPRAATELAVTGIPALRLLSPDGRVVASREGAMSAEELVQWLTENYAAAASPISDEVVADGPPSAVAIVRILREFRRREPTLREAAISRLAPWPGLAAAPVLACFRDGTLAERLAARELLFEWGAPLDELDPWQPDTITSDRLELIENWLQSSQFREADPEVLSPLAALEADRILRMMVTADPAAAASMREQLSRMGPGVSPLVRDALAAAVDETARERLTAARYRLAASRELVVNWPGGIERLSSRSFDVRLEAAGELVDRARSGDEELLLTLFSDPAPLIREISLRALQQVSGSSANGALVRLLDDPDANVRAAVLKKLAESPDARLAPVLASFAARESDPDLVVHAVRVLREMNDPAALEALQDLLQHVSWRVRAEATEGLGRLLADDALRNGFGAGKIGDRLTELLKDEDDFVVGRAVTALATLAQRSEVVARKAYEPLVQTAANRPELTGIIIEAVMRDASLRERSAPLLTASAGHSSPSVRAVAIPALVYLEQERALPQLELALKDEEAIVRIAAARTIFQEAKRKSVDLVQRPWSLNSDGVEPVTLPLLIRRMLLPAWLQGSKPLQEKEQEKEAPSDAPDATADAPSSEDLSPAEKAIQQFRKNRQPEWLFQTTPGLSLMLDSSDQTERLAAARALAVLGEEAALPVLYRSVGEPELHRQLAETLPALGWAERSELFRRLAVASTSRGEIEETATSFLETEDDRSADELWKIIGQPAFGDELTAGLIQPLQRAYSGNENRIVQGPINSPALTAAVKKYLAQGTSMQRLAALVLQAKADRDAAAEVALPLLKDADWPADLRSDALKVVLWCHSPREGQDLAIEMLNDDDPLCREAALAYLALEAPGVETLSHGMNLSNGFYSALAYSSYSQAGSPIVIEPPKGLQQEMLRPWLEREEEEIRAQAAYLLVLLDQADALPHLLQYWESHPSDERYRRLVWRAVAYLDDEQYVPVLEKVFVSLQGDDYARIIINEFYWSIRPMHGSRVIRLRKQIRDAYGQSLR